MFVAWEQLKTDGTKGIYIITYEYEIPYYLRHLECLPVVDVEADVWEYKRTKKRFIPDGRG